MAEINKVEGVPNVLSNLDRQTEALGRRIAKGLKTAGLVLQRDSQTHVPVDFGVLKASAFTRAQGDGAKTIVTVGYTASYALFVHELVGMKLKGQPRTAPSKGKYWDPQGRAYAKFLEEPFRRLTPAIIKIVQEAAKLS